MKDKLGMRIGESAFSIGYLLFAFISGIIFLQSRTQDLAVLYASLVLILAVGDSFHLVPRIIKNIKGSTKRIEWWMNLGKIITSITMTIFYIILFYIWKKQYGKEISIIITCLIWILSLARIILCLLPQNNWFKGGNRKMSMIRNGVFTVMGILEIILFFSLKNNYGIIMAISIFLSFLFYLPVTFYAKDKPKIGMLMIPKTIMYMIMISLGYRFL